MELNVFLNVCDADLAAIFFPFLQNVPESSRPVFWCSASDRNPHMFDLEPGSGLQLSVTLCNAFGCCFVHFFYCCDWSPHLKQASWALLE